MKRILLLLLMAFAVTINAQNTCSNPFPVCSSFSYSATVNNTTPTGGPSYGCLNSQPNPTWFYTKVTSSGAIQYNISSLQGYDVDFVCWGPFSNMNNMCAQLSATNIIDCSYSASPSETLTIPGGVTGQYYMILVTNYSNAATTIDFQNMPNTGTACSYFEGISGHVYHDLNTDCLYDATDVFTRNIPVKQYDNLGNFMGMSYQNTYINQRIPYRFYCDTGSYDIRIDSANVPYTAQCVYPGLDSLVSLTTAFPRDTNVNFSIKCKPGFDLNVQSIYRSGWVFPGLGHMVKITAGDLTQQFYNLSCATNVGGQVVVNFSGPVSYLSTLSTIQPSSVFGNSITYTITDFSAVDIYDDFLIALNTATSAVVGDSICVDVAITAMGDNDLSNNQKHYCYQVTNSYDPNMKETYPEQVMPGYHDWFYYTIHFQNTGTAAAQNIALTDTLSSYFDLSTFERINYSHSNSTVLAGQVLQFNFDNINLPDSTSNDAGSKGFVQYRVKPKANLPAGTVIDNRAFIYFDYNAPIITNTTHNTYALVTGIKTVAGNEFAIYPNPSTGMINIVPEKNAAIMNVSVHNIIGDVVFEDSNLHGKSQLDLGSLSNGVYIVKVSLQGAKPATYKLVIQK